MVQVVGWDIGGANLKAACVTTEGDRITDVLVASRPFEIWRGKELLAGKLKEIYSRIVKGNGPLALAVTMTAELSDAFATKREGVLFILESIHAAFPETPAYILNLSGHFVPLESAKANPLEFAAANWVATAEWFSGKISNCLLVDTGSTTTDILPILDGRVSVSGRTDMERLASGELVFTGMLRTNLATIVPRVPIGGRSCRVASEYFAISGDVHLILGHIREKDYDCSTPDGQPPSLESARRRLARLVCADVEILSAAEIDEMARYVYTQQVRMVSEGMSQVLSRLPELRNHPVVPVGAGAFLGSDASRMLGLEAIDPAAEWGSEELAVAPCLASACLLAGRLRDPLK